MKITIYHHQLCGTSRTTLALIRAAGIEPEVVDYRAHPPTHEQLAAMIASAGLTVRAALRAKEPIFSELGLADRSLSDAALLDAALANPVLINRPFVVTPLGARLCRPAELVHEILA